MADCQIFQLAIWFTRKWVLHIRIQTTCFLQSRNRLEYLVLVYTCC